jgi:hypothetical protein
MREYPRGFETKNVFAGEGIHKMPNCELMTCISQGLSFLDQHAGAVQAICAVVALVGLIWYCALTHGIRKATVRQANAALMPFLIIVEQECEPIPTWIIRNAGNGPAREINWKPGASNEPDTPNKKAWFRIGDLGVNDWTHLPHYSRPNEMKMHERPRDGLRLHYCDLAGNHFAMVGYFDGEVFYQNCSPIRKKDRTDLNRHRATNQYGLHAIFHLTSSRPKAVK